MEEFILTRPTSEYASQIALYRQEFLDAGDSMDGTGALRKTANPEEYIKLSIQDGIEKAGIIGEMTAAGLNIEVSGTPIEFKNYTYQEKDALSGDVKTYVDNDNGYFEMKMKVVVHKGQVSINTEIIFGFEAAVETLNGNKYFKLSDVFFNFTAYEVTSTIGR